MKLQRTGAALLISKLWPDIFDNAASNKVATISRGLNPFNHVLLQNSDLRSTMTLDEIANEKEKYFVS